ncbi:MAG: 3-deoxy-D-manno-octulosonic acid transferase [Desulfuromonadaceae bacterium]|nr:3-deoxy-D-manno-octulosonic acid transferase [Desulfuromonadaceae bacterium]
MVYLLYDIVLLLGMVVLIPWYLVRGCIRGKVRQGLRERLGFISSAELDKISGRQTIWIHAVSVGETRAAIPLIKELRRVYPDTALVLSNVTETGRQIAESIAEIDVFIYFPVDFSLTVARALDAIKPALVLIVETELWPQFVRKCYQRSIPVMLVNGRISDRSFPRYKRLGALLHPVLHQISLFCMQSQQDASRIEALGAPSERIQITGNVKFDQGDSTPAPLDAAKLRVKFALQEGVKVWVAGSTHQGEDEIVIRTYRNLLKVFPNLILILVPRHPHRCRHIGELLTQEDLAWRLRSSVSKTPLEPGGVLLVDTLGEMLDFYTLANVVFVGGSLVPVGGHNILEASMVNKPVLFGPYMQNFKEIAQYVTAAQGFGEVADAAELEQLVTCLLQNPAVADTAGLNGAAILQQHAGATAHTLTVMKKLLEP